MEKDKYFILDTIRNSTLLSPVSRSTFYSSSKHIMKTKQYIDELIKCGYISEQAVSGELSVTIVGFAALEAVQSKKREDVRYWITTAIAIVALIVSILQR